MRRRTYNGGTVVHYVAVPPTTEHKISNGSHKTKAEIISVDFCINHCPNKSCNGDKCKQLNEFIKEQLK